MTTAWMIYNGNLAGDKFRDQAELLQEAAMRKGVEARIVANDELFIDATSSFPSRPDFAVLLDKDVLLGRFLRTLHIPVYNDPEVIERCDNKAHQYISLAQANVPMPQTIVAPKTYPNAPLQNERYLDHIIETLGFPMIVKEGRGSFGMHVYLIQTRDELLNKVATLGGVDFIFQKYVASSHGRDIRVNIIGDDIVAAMQRTSDCDFRANITNGGTASTVVLTDAQKNIALRAAQAVGATFAGVDLLFDENEQPLVCEVNAAAHIRNIYNVTGINVADAMIDYILEDLK